MKTQEILQLAKQASLDAALLSSDEKNRALSSMADALINNIPEILKANDLDMENSKGNISDVMLDRLMINESRIRDMAEGIRNVIDLPDPVGKTFEEFISKDGLNIKKVSVPMGVIAIIYESRPNVTADAAALTLKSGNSCVLRCGKEAYKTSKAIMNSMQEGLKTLGLNENMINLVDDTTRESANMLMTSPEFVDLLIPRGGAGLIKSCVENAIVPCIETGTGICHIYVDESADLDMAVKIVVNAKTSRPSVCNAEEVLLVNENIAEKFLPMIKKALVEDRSEKGLVPVELRLDAMSAKIIDGLPASEKDFDTEFLDYILAVKIVDSVESAIKHVSLHSTGHSDAIISYDEKSIEKFTRSVDSAAVYVNASTRFTDGGVFGLGCEIGISTQKLHARGPMGLREMTTYKYIITGNGNIR